MADKKPTKRENGIDFPAEAYAYVPDPESPSTWKLRLWEDLQQKETPRQVGMAIAALSPGGFRGNRVEIPREDLPKVKARIRAAWKKVHPDADEEDLPPVLREGVIQEDGQAGTHLLEYANSAQLHLRVDRDRGIIQGVKILGLESSNRRRYLPEALIKAIGLYEGIAVNVDHIPSGQIRSYRDRIGKLVNVRFGGDGLFGDLLVNPRHALAEQLFWDAENAPEKVGLSHDAKGRTVSRDGTLIVEAIESVRSVDLVAEPATTRSLYEAAVDAVLQTDVPPHPTTQTEPEPAPDDEPSIDDPDTLPDEAFALVLPGGVRIKDKTYPLHKRYFPIHTPEAVKRSYLAVLHNRKLSSEHRERALQRIQDAASRFGVDLSHLARESHMDLSKLTLAELKEARPDLIEALMAQTETQKELVALKAERDALAKELAEIKHKEQVRKELGEANLSPEDLPESLRELLETTLDEQKRKKAISDFQKLIENRKPVSVRSGARPHDLESLVASWRL